MMPLAPRREEVDGSVVGLDRAARPGVVDQLLKGQGREGRNDGPQAGDSAPEHRI